MGNRTARNTSEDAVGVKKKEPPPFASLRFDFVDSMENVCNQSMMLLQAVASVVDSKAVSMPDGIRDILRERHKALQSALIGDE